MTAAWQRPAPHITTVPMPADMAPQVAALGCLVTAGPREHLALPSDLYMLTVHRAAGSAALDIAVTLLRTRAERFRSQGGSQLAFALLTPRGLLALLRTPLQGRADGRVWLDALCTAAELRRLRGLLLRGAGLGERLFGFARWLEERIKRRHGLGPAQARVAEAAASLHHATDAAPDWAALRARLGLSRRQVERDFSTWLGVSPHGYARLLRFQRTAQMLAQGLTQGQGLVEAANANCFFDQAHMNRSFQGYATLTPRELAAAAAFPQRRLEQRALAGRVLLVDAPAATAAGAAR